MPELRAGAGCAGVSAVREVSREDAPPDAGNLRELDAECAGLLADAVGQEIVAADGALFFRVTSPSMPRTCLRWTRITPACSSQSSQRSALA